MRKRFKRAVGRASRLGGGGGCVVGGPCQKWVPSQGTTIPGVYDSNCHCVRGDFENKFASAGRMVGMSGGRDLDGFVGTERSTFVSASGCGYSNASGCYANQSGGGGMTADQFINQMMLQGLGINEVLEIMAQLPPDYFDSAPSEPQGNSYGSTAELLDALAGNEAGSGGGGGGISDFLDSLADPNDISSGEFGGVDSLLDDLAGGAVGPTTPVMSGGGDGMPPPPPVMSGGGDGMPPPPPVMSGGGDGMPPPPRTQPTTQPMTPSVRRRMSARVKSPYANGRSKASPQRNFIGDAVGLAGAGRVCKCRNSVGGTTNVACGNLRCRQCCRKWSNS